MKKITLLLMIIMCVCFQNCENHTEDNVVPSGNNPGSGGNGNGGGTKMTANLPVKIYSYEAVTTIEYDSQNRFSNILYLNQDGPFGYYSNTFLTYSNDTLKQIKTDSNYNKEQVTTIFDLSYALDTIFIRNQNNGNVEKIAISKNNQMVYRKNGLGTASFTYDAKGRVLTGEHLEIQLVTTYSYDSTNGVFKNVNLPSWTKHYLAGIIAGTIFNNCENNVKYISSNFNSVSPVTYYYQYNSNNYPEYVGTSIDGVFQGYSYQIEYSK